MCFIFAADFKFFAKFFQNNCDLNLGYLVTHVKILLLFATNVFPGVCQFFLKKYNKFSFLIKVILKNVYVYLIPKKPALEYVNIYRFYWNCNDILK